MQQMDGVYPEDKKEMYELLLVIGQTVEDMISRIVLRGGWPNGHCR